MATVNGTVHERPLQDYLADVSEHGEVRRGIPVPQGTHEFAGGVNFALFSRHASRVRLELFDSGADAIPTKVVELDPARNRTGDIWHVWVRGLGPGQFYAYRVDGPYQPKDGHRFNFNKLLIDPYATAITQSADWDFDPARGEDSDADGCAVQSTRDDAAAMPKSIFTHEHFDWRDDRPPRHSWARTIIYETHVRGFTVRPGSGVQRPGTYRGLMEKIPYLKDLGITAVELMPVQEFNEKQVKGVHPDTGAPLGNYWGYDPVAFFAPKASYSSAGGAGQQQLEFKEMVRHLHAAGIEVILDVVFNHTAEGDQHGPTLSWRGIDNSIFYTLAKDKRSYIDASGAGNTINANHPIVRELILSALRYWVVEMHVDGFRFDLASILGRDGAGRLLANPPLLEQIAEDSILRETKLIAEAWDAAGAYQVGSFSERRWAEWNGRYRDDVRRFWRGDDAMLGAFASRICGSADLYARSGKGPECSINFLTCHDGFTLNDLVSFRQSHNRANGETNRDGPRENFSENYGAEGHTQDQAIESIRRRQIKNFLLTLFISRGVPMLLGGDEFRRTQRGNSNAYCQDNETSWYDWSDLQRHRDIHRFVRGMIALRVAHPVLSREEFYTDATIRWFNRNQGLPHWRDPHARALACLIQDDSGEPLFLMFNAGLEVAVFRIPAAPSGGCWRLAVDTNLETPDDVPSVSGGPTVDPLQPYEMGPRSGAVLVCAARAMLRRARTE